MMNVKFKGKLDVGERYQEGFFLGHQSTGRGSLLESGGFY